jgi:CubicO group peptidase (beta-lactamase class C family)
LSDTLQDNSPCFDRLTAAIQQGVQRGLHTCVQVFVSVDGETVLNQGLGMATEDMPATSETVMLWRSAGKPLTAAGILRLQETGDLSLGDPLGKHLPNAAGRTFGTVILHQLLSHALGLPILDTRWPDATWDETLVQILAFDEPLEPGRVAYQPQATWFLLGEVLRLRTETSSFQDALQNIVLDPMGLTQCQCGLAPDTVNALKDRLPDLLHRTRGGLKRTSLSDAPALTAPSPGGNMRGPVSQLGAFYEMLQRRGTLPDGSRYLKESSVQLMTSRHRSGFYDHGLQHKIDMGLGCLINSEHHGPAVPYGYGKHSSSSAFGHGGAQCAMGFCDPVHNLVVVWAANGLCGEPQHQRRNRSINEAIYADLGLAS